MSATEQRDPGAGRKSAADRHAKLAIDARSGAGAIESMRAEIEAEALAQMGDCPAPQIAALFKNGDFAAAAREINRRRQSSNPTADDDDVFLHCLRIVPQRGASIERENRRKSRWLLRLQIR